MLAHRRQLRVLALKFTHTQSLDSPVSWTQCAIRLGGACTNLVPRYKTINGETRERRHCMVMSVVLPMHCETSHVDDVLTYSCDDNLPGSVDRLLTACKYDLWP